MLFAHAWGEATLLAPAQNNIEIAKILPHRYPFLLVDKVIHLEKMKRAVGVKPLGGWQMFVFGPNSTPNRDAALVHKKCSRSPGNGESIPSLALDWVFLLSGPITVRNAWEGFTEARDRLYLDLQSGTFTGSGAGLPTPAFFWIWSGAFSKSLYVGSQGFAFFVV